MPDLREHTLLNAVTSTGAGTAVSLKGARFSTIYWTATGVTSGATVQIQAADTSGDYHAIHEEVIADNTATTAINALVIEGAYDGVRANVTAYTDGTYTVEMHSRGG